MKRVNAYGYRSKRISAKSEELFGRLLAQLEARHHVAKLPTVEGDHVGYASGSVRARTLAMFKEGAEVSTSDVAAQFGISRNYAWSLLQQLFDDGYIQIDGVRPKRGSPPIKVYTMVEAA